MHLKPRTLIYLISVLFTHIAFILPSAAVVRIMPLGDSITEGSASNVVPDNSDYWVSYRKALWDQLTAAGYDIDFVGTLSSGDMISNFDPDHEGHGGWSDDDIVYGNPSNTAAGKLADWLADQQPDIVLLHIGTNDLQTNADAVEAILDEIDAYSPDVWVVLARIINRSCIFTLCSQSATTTAYNNNVEAMALDRMNNPANSDRIVIVDMEDGAGIDYHGVPDGDMANNLHPFATGYAKMADLWFAALMEILPYANAGPDQIVFDEITLDGSLSDPGGTPLSSYQWQLQHREDPAFDRTANGVNPIVSDLKKGFYDVTLTVTDDEGKSAVDNMFFSATGLKGDFDFDGDVDQDDLSVFSGYFGWPQPGPLP